MTRIKGKVYYFPIIDFPLFDFKNDMMTSMSILVSLISIITSVIVMTIAICK